MQVAARRQSKRINMCAWGVIVCVVVAVLFSLVHWCPWYAACRVGEAGLPGPVGIFTKHLKCDHCATWLSSNLALRAHTSRFHDYVVAKNSAGPMSESPMGGASWWYNPLCGGSSQDKSYGQPTTQGRAICPREGILKSC